MGWKRLGLDQGTRDALGIEPSSRLGMVTRSHAGEREVRHTGGEPARDHAADGAEAGNGDAGYRHQRTLRMRAPELASYAARPAVTSPWERCVKRRLDHHRAEGQILRAMMEEPNAQEFIRRGVRNLACGHWHGAVADLPGEAADDDHSVRGRRSNRCARPGRGATHG